MSSDPSLEGGFIQLFQREVDITIRNSQTEFEDKVMVRIFRGPSCVKLELTSEANVSFFYCCKMNNEQNSDNSNKKAEDFHSNNNSKKGSDSAHRQNDSNKRENLTKSLQNGNKSLGDWLKNLFYEDHSFSLELESQDGAILLVQKEEKYKKYQIGRVEVFLGSQKELRESIMYRYERMKARQAMLDQYWLNMCGVVKTKNPSLLLQLQARQKKYVFK